MAPNRKTTKKTKPRSKLKSKPEPDHKPEHKPGEKWWLWKKGRPKTGGRKVGTPNKSTTVVKDAAVTAVNEHPQFPGGLVDYLQWVAVVQPAAYLALLAKLIPHQLEATLRSDLTIRRTTTLKLHDIKNVSPQELELMYAEMINASNAPLALTAPVETEEKGEVIDIEPHGTVQ